MRYPKHIILDLQDSHFRATHHSWTESYLKIPQSNSVNLKEPSSLFAKFEARRKDSGSSKTSHFAPKSSLTQSLFDIHFLRKEKLYTKLKYSRCPQYDIVSGGFAAMFAGFIGFLISEKFGIELVDSADFYNAFMYGVFGVFALRPFLRVYSADNTPYHPLSPKYLLLFLRDVFILGLRAIIALFTLIYIRI